MLAASTAQGRAAMSGGNEGIVYQARKPGYRVLDNDFRIWQAG